MNNRNDQRECRSGNGNPFTTSQEPRISLFVTDSKGDMLWQPNELRKAYPRLYKAVMRQYTKGRLSFCRNNVNVYFITMYAGAGYESH